MCAKGGGVEFELELSAGEACWAEVGGGWSEEWCWSGAGGCRGGAEKGGVRGRFAEVGQRKVG